MYASTGKIWKLDFDVMPLYKTSRQDLVIRIALRPLLCMDIVL